MTAEEVLRLAQECGDLMILGDGEESLAEGGRFELPRGLPLAVFKTAAFVHSAIPPRPSIAPTGGPVVLAREHLSFGVSLPWAMDAVRMRDAA